MLKTHIVIYKLPIDQQVVADIKHLAENDCDEIRRSSALFNLKLKEKQRLTQVAINDVIEGSRSIFDSTMQYIQAAFRSRFADLGLDPNQLNKFEDVFRNIEHPFDNLLTQHQQEKYFSSELSLVVSS